MECTCHGDDLFGECASASTHEYMHVDGGESFSIGVTQGGGVVGWGTAFYGELGEDPRRDDESKACIRVPPTVIRMPTKCSAVSCGVNHVMALTFDDREVYAWGRNHCGQTARSPTDTPFSSCPTRVVISSGATSAVVIALAAGGNHSLALDSDGNVWSWGDNSLGQLGISTSSTHEYSPHRVQLPQLTRTKAIAGGYAHSVLLAGDGGVCSFGWGLYHQLGHGTTDDARAPRRVDALDGIDGGFSAVACGTWHTVAISSQGDVYTWGWGPDGQLGPSHGKSERLPRVVDTEDAYFASGGDGHHAVRVVCGARFTAVVSREGEVFMWGRGGGPAGSSFRRERLGRRRVELIAAGHSHTLLLASTQATL